MNGSVTSSAATEALREASIGAYVSLTKPKQTALLLATAIGAYVLTASPKLEWARAALGILAIGLAVSGCTVLNMVLDRDIDKMMGRTASRPLPVGAIDVHTATVLGMLLSTTGVVMAALLSLTFFAVIGCGLFFDLIVYTLWLKRRTPFSILSGGFSGGMPALAGRVLALGHIDVVGLLLAAGVVLWIPAHILTLALRYEGEYADADVPVWPRVYGAEATRRVIAGGALLAAIVLTAAGFVERIAAPALITLGVLGGALCALATFSLFRPSERANWRLFKVASLYMLAAFGCLTFGAVL